MDGRVKEILSDYDEKKSLNKAFTEKLKSFTQEILSQHGIHVHTLTERVKKRNSLEKKINKKESYLSLNDITDVCGIRITTYYEDDIPKIAELIQEYFKIDNENSVNKKETLDPSTFGYLSLHYVISFNEERENLFEYSRFKGLKAEIQIRSILQHAWAEIEHDLGYKSKVPAPIRRRFSMLAGLLELADREFIHIKEDLKQYEHNLPEQIKLNPEDVKIDKLSLKQFILDNDIAKEINKYIEDTIGISLDYKSLDNLDDSVNQLEKLEIKTISSLNFELNTYKDKIKSAIYKIFLDKEQDTLRSEIGIYYLVLLLIAKGKNITDFIEQMNSIINMEVSYEMHKDFVDTILEVVNE